MSHATLPAGGLGVFSLWVYLRFLLSFPVLLAALAGVIAGGLWMWTGAVVLAILAIGGDELLPENARTEQYARPALLDAFLFATLPLILAIYVALIWQAVDRIHLPMTALILQGFFGWVDKGPSGWFPLLGGVLSASLMAGISATNVAHELMHRRNRLAVMFGRMLLTFSFDVPLIISHLYGHHINVGTREDHTTARRGEPSYSFIARSTFGGNLNAWRIESLRMRGQKRSPLNWRNRFLQGHFLALAMAAGSWCVGGWPGVFLFFILAVLAKSILELINYIQHYGLIRLPGMPIELRHSWNSNKVVSSYLLFNVTRHSHHHAVPSLPYWALKSYPDAPCLRRGYLTSMLIALIPPWWHRHMRPSLSHWDASFASQGEQKIAASENRLSGLRLPALEATPVSETEMQSTQKTGTGDSPWV
jgi:alkane 1-monooxygenase